MLNGRILRYRIKVDRMMVLFFSISNVSYRLCVLEAACCNGECSNSSSLRTLNRGLVEPSTEEAFDYVQFFFVALLVNAWWVFRAASPF